MKRKQENIASIFAKHFKKESGDKFNPIQHCETQSINPSPTPTPSSIPSSQDEEKESETNINFKTPTSTYEERLTSVDVLNLPQDPGKRRRMSQFHPSDRDIVRREYCSRDLCQPYKHEFKLTKFGTKNRRFNPKWFDKYKTWLEYNVEKDAAFCFACYLFKDDNVGQDSFVMDGFRNWKRPKSFDVHVGANMSAHRIAMKTKELLICMASFSPSDGFSSFDTKQLLNLATFYPNEFPKEDLVFFEESLISFIGDVRNDERFLNVKTLNELSLKLVETRMHETHSDVYKLLKLVLLLPVTTASVERSFSAMNHIKNKVQNSMGEQLLNDCMITFLEKDLFLNVSNDAIVHRFQNMKTRREQL